MDIFNVLELLGGLALFLFGMNVMGNALEKRAGGSLKTILSKTTSGRVTGFLMGLGVTGIIQSSSATTVMVVGFVNSGLMNLRQAINVIMGANVGTTVTAWLLSLTGIDGGTLWVQMLKPTSWTPILAIIGIAMIMFSKKSTKHDVATIFLGFAVLMFGMDTMSGAVSGLKDVPQFQQMMVMFSNPILGVLAGAVLTGIIQSSSASVGILQALSSTGQITFGAAIPVIMGQNIGTTVTALISSVGTNKNARRAAVVHLTFNIVGTVVWLTIFTVANWIFDFAFTELPINEFYIAIVHSIFNILSTSLMLPLSGWLERFACRIIKDDKENSENRVMLDERLLTTPTVALDHCRSIACDMANIAASGLKNSLACLHRFDLQLAEKIRKQEDEVDHYEKVIGDYLLKLSNCDLSEKDNTEVAKLLHVIGDLERMSDHAVNILESAEEMHDKKLQFSAEAQSELDVMIGAIEEIVTMAQDSFVNNDTKLPIMIEPLEDVVDSLKDQLRMRHILRLQRGTCTVELGFIWSDLLTNLERVSDHCSNIGGCVLETNYGAAEAQRGTASIQHSDPRYIANRDYYANKYALVSPDCTRPADSE